MESPRRTCDWPTERSIPMPEEPEVEIEKVDEAVHEAIELARQLTVDLVPGLSDA